MKSCVFWICSGKEKYWHETQESARRMAEYMPDLDRFVFSTEDRGPLSPPLFQGRARLAKAGGEYWYLNSVVYFNKAYEMLVDQGYEAMLYLDTDTYPMAPVPEIFELAPYFDVVGIHGSRRITGATVEPIPWTFPEFEIGVTLFTANNRTLLLLELWQELHWENPEVYGNNDQRSFREAMWRILPEGLRVGTMPTEYGCRWPFGVFVSLPVKMLHGRALGPAYPDSPMIAEVEAIINEHQDMRIWSPRDPRWREGVIPRNYDGG